MKKRGWFVWTGIGIIFLLNAILGRYIVLPGYLSGLEAGSGNIETAGQVAPVWKIIRFGLQTEAASFASRIMIELVLGWLFIFLSYSKRPRASSPCQ